MRKKNQWRIYDIYSGKSENFNLPEKKQASCEIDKGIKSSRFIFTNFIKGGLTVLISVLIIYGVVQAGTITPPNGTPSAQFYTLSEIYTRLTTNATSSEGGHSFTFADSLAGTGRTLTEIYNAIPTINPSKLLDDTTYLGITGNIATRTLSADSETVSAGYYAATTLSAVDADLAAGNIKKNTAIFGITGTLYGDTDSAKVCSNAIAAGTLTIDASKVLSGTTYCGTGGSIANCSSEGGNACYAASGYWTSSAGSNVTGADGSITFNIPNGYYSGKTCTAQDTDLIEGNIKSGVTIFGIDGDGNVVDTLAGTVTDNAQIRSNYVCFSDGTQYTGSISDCSSEGSQSCYVSGTYFAGTSKTPNNSTTSQSAGYYPAFDLATFDTDLTVLNIKKNTAIFGITGTYSGYSGSGGGLAGLTQTNCTDQEAGGGWYWFEDGNGDGDTTDPEDGVCVQNTLGSTPSSWNGAEQITPNNLTAKTIVSATTSTATVADGSWTPGTNYINHIAKVLTGTGDAINCWGRVKSVNDDTDTITVYGTWLGTDYNACSTTPGANNTVAIFDDWKDDNFFIGDYSCSGSFPSGTATYNNYPSSGTNALAMADCLDGQRDLLPTEADRSVVTGTATAVDATTITDTALALGVNHWVGQKLKITSGLAANSYGLIESNTATVITIGGWLDAAGNPAEGDEIPSGTPTFAIVYIVPHGSYVPDAEIEGAADDYDNVSGNNGPLKPEVLANWQGTRLPDSATFFGYCGYKDGGSDYYETSCSSDKNFGTWGGQNGRTAECMDLANNAYEWLSEQHYNNFGRLAGGYACSHFSYVSVNGGYRFRAVFRP